MLNENLTLQLQKLNSQIAEVIDIFKKYDKVKLLGGLTYNHIQNPTDQDNDGLADINLEYALSLATAMKETSSVQPTILEIRKLTELLVLIRHTYTEYEISKIQQGNSSKPEDKIKVKKILKSLYSRGDGFMRHVHHVFEELYYNHNDVIEKKYGFNAKDIQETTLQIATSFYCRYMHPDGKPHEVFLERLKDWLQKKSIDIKESPSEEMINEFVADNPDIHLINNVFAFYKIDDIGSYRDLFKITFKTEKHQKVVDALSQNFGDNSEFILKHHGYPISESNVFTHPIIKIRNNYYLFSISLLTFSLFTFTESLIKNADSAYYNEKFLGNKNPNSRDNYLESKTLSVFKKLIPNSEYYLNVDYKSIEKDNNGKNIKAELDVLVVSKDANYIIEVKAGTLSDAAKRGAILSLISNLKKIVGKGISQSYRALEYILNTEKPVFLDNKSEIFINKKKKIFRILITLDKLSELTSYVHDYKELGIISKDDISLTWSCNLFDLLVFAEIIESENDFIDYLEKRIPLYNNPKIEPHDELHLLGCFLETDLEFDENNLAEFNSKLDKYSVNIGKYFQRNGEKPIRRNKQ